MNFDTVTQFFGFFGGSEWVSDHCGRGGVHPWVKKLQNRIFTLGHSQVLREINYLMTIIDGHGVGVHSGLKPIQTLQKIQKIVLQC